MLSTAKTLKECRECDEYIDLVIMKDPKINDGSEWLLGDEVRVREGQSDVVYNDNDDLGWLDVEEVIGVAKHIFNTRSQAALQKADATTIAPAAPPPSKYKGKGNQGAKISKGRGKQLIVVDEYDPKFVNDWGMKKKRIKMKILKRNRMRQST